MDNLYWDGDGFGPRQVGQLFDVEDLPLIIEDNRGTSLFLQILDDEVPVICYHSLGEIIGAFAVPDDNVTLVRDSAIACPDCKDSLLLYQSSNNAVRVCLCGYSEEVK